MRRCDSSSGGRGLAWMTAALVLLLLTASVTDGYPSNERDLILGHRQNGDRLLEQKLVERHSLPLLKVDETVTVKGDGFAQITSIEAIDIKGNGYNAKPVIVRGGPGETFVTLYFESQRGHGIHYLVKVYAI